MKQLTNLLSLNKQTNIIATILLLMSLCFLVVEMTMVVIPKLWMV